MIGIFDSGLGGLTALKEIRSRFPGEDLVYFGDTGRVPYGSRSRDIIIRYAMQDMRFLLRFSPRAVIAACGTVSTTALTELRKTFSLPIIGVVEGAVDAAVRATRNKTVAVIGTSATIRSGAFPRALRAADPSLTVVEQACPLFVHLVENGFASPEDPVARLVCERYLAPIRASGADTLILGCTHYPLLAEIIRKVLPGVTLINTGAEAAGRAAALLPPPDGTESGTVRYFVSDDPSQFRSGAALFLGEDFSGQAELIRLEASDTQ